MSRQNPFIRKKKGWGEPSGYRLYLYERNRDIKAKFSEGATIEALAEEYEEFLTKYSKFLSKE